MNLLCTSFTNETLAWFLLTNNDFLILVLDQVSNLCDMGARMIFSRCGQRRGLKDGSSPAGSRGSSRVGGGWGWHFLKMMHKYFVYWVLNTSSTEVLDNICSKNTFQHFQGVGTCPPPCPCLRSPMVVSYVLLHFSIFSERVNQCRWLAWCRCQ